jgi:hypothetical protein
VKTWSSYGYIDWLPLLEIIIDRKFLTNISIRRVFVYSITILEVSNFYLNSF